MERDGMWWRERSLIGSTFTNTIPSKNLGHHSGKEKKERKKKTSPPEMIPPNIIRHTHLSPSSPKTTFSFFSFYVHIFWERRWFLFCFRTRKISLLGSGRHVSLWVLSFFSSSSFFSCPSIIIRETEEKERERDNYIYIIARACIQLNSALSSLSSPTMSLHLLYFSSIKVTLGKPYFNFLILFSCLMK